MLNSLPFRGFDQLRYIQFTNVGEIATVDLTASSVALQFVETATPVRIMLLDQLDQNLVFSSDTILLQDLLNPQEELTRASLFFRVKSS